MGETGSANAWSDRPVAIMAIIRLTANPTMIQAAELSTPVIVQKPPRLPRVARINMGWKLKNMRPPGARVLHVVREAKDRA